MHGAPVTRGTLDPTIVSYLVRAERTSADEVVQWLNERSGLLGISGRSRDVRAEICSGMQWCGPAIDSERNRVPVGREAVIGAAGARIGAFVIPADEEIVIARDTVACPEGSG